jgi:predicted dehydrogenase
MGVNVKVAIIGCGLIGEKRARSLGNHQLTIVSDINKDRAKFVGNINNRNAIIAENWKEAASHPEVDIVIVSTSNNLLTPIGQFALENNKHVLIEKPGARNSDEIKGFFDKSMKSGKKVKVGFNLRYHPAMIKAKEIISSGEIGELMFIRGRYGHGGRVGYDKEWRANPEISGGGELIDQGVHLIDLSRWFMGDFEKIEGFADTYFWDMKVDDNGFISLRTNKGRAAWLQVSCTEWKNMFCLEIYGKYGKLQIDGLGGSYGVEKLSYYKMSPEMGPPDTTIWEYPGEDKSWKIEFNGFIDTLENGGKLNGDLNDAYQALRIVDKIYGRIK